MQVRLSTKDPKVVFSLGSQADSMAMSNRNY
jgi:hypothetical protein